GGASSSARSTKSPSSATCKPRSRRRASAAKDDRMTKKTEQPAEPVLTGVDELIELPRSIEPKAPVLPKPDPLDQWVDAWAKTQALPTVMLRLKTELKAR